MVLKGRLEGVTWAIAGAADLYEKLENAVPPLYYGYENDPGGSLRVMKGAIGKNAAYFNSHRMMSRNATEFDLH